MREVRIRDTMSGAPAVLEPGSDGTVGIYACGPTVYDRIHIGNARPYVVFSVLRRFLEAEGYEPRLVINVTDVNDKIYDAAREAGEGSAAFAERMTASYVADTDALGLGRPDAEPLATRTVGEIIALIEALIESGNAYESSGDVYFKVRSFPAYGALSNRSPDEMDQGEEAGAAELKGDRLDFALWKATKPGEDTSWDSPWGPGRPGWHIECSAMAEALLGTEISIHGGGSDLIFPHHENEEAQTAAARGRPLARIWMHNGMVQAGERKMSKSEGDVFLLHNAVERYGAATIVMFLLSGHYRQPLAFSEAELDATANRVERLRGFLASAPAAPDAGPEVADYLERFRAALADDFNTPRALAEIHSLVAAARREPIGRAHEAVASMLDVLGLGSLAEPVDAPQADARATELAAERDRARAERDFARADEIRDELAALGWAVTDTPDGPQLRPL
ncbi:cysteine--tRNA ligase [Thermoleophilia bacterium SCSIO 60948]|nr:cysteine--tRNA ligase [Thermoleophilia bacterium SCSIO 60948]